jgi:hypothetical protein
MMIAPRRYVKLAGMTLTAVFLLVAFGVGTASAAEPWWHLASGSRPTALGSTAPTSEVQQIVASPGTIFGLAVNKHELGCFNFAPYCPEEATAANVQAMLESSEAYGEGNVEVTGGPAGTAPLVVRSIKADAGRPVAPIEALVLAGSAEATVLTAASTGELTVQAYNLGDATLDAAGEPVTIVDKLPAGLEALGVDAVPGGVNLPVGEGLSCTLQSASEVRCTFEGTLPAYWRLEATIPVLVAESAHSGEINEIIVSGGGAPSTSIDRAITVAGSPAPFGVETYEMRPEAEGGAADPLAATHPFQLTTTLAFNETGETPYQPAQPRNLTIELPPGLIGDASATKRCTSSQFSILIQHGKNECPNDSVVGVVEADIVQGNGPHTAESQVIVPLNNLVPNVGEPARFGFLASGVPIVLDTSLRSSGNYGVTISVRNISQFAGTLKSIVTFWGTPGDPRHDASRGLDCLAGEAGCVPAGETNPAPLLRLPSSCASSLHAPITVQSWAPGVGALDPVPSAFEEALIGCNREPFEPRLKVESSASAAATPTQLTVHLKVPQQASETPEGVAEADVKNTTVALPAGLQVNPAAAAGLAACSESEIGYLNKRGENGELLFAEEAEAERDGEKPERYTCPEPAKLGKVKITTPLLEEDLTGWVYQAAQDSNPFGSLLALYVIAEAPKAGVRVRLAGEVKVQPDGQLVSTFPVTPQLPFEEFELKFFGGEKAPLATTGCGAYATSSSIESWAGGASASPFSEFDVSTAPGGAPCASLGAFTPSFAAGASSAAAGAYTPLTMTLSRKDGEQALSTVTMTLPSGLAGMIAKVPQCGQAQASVGACPVASKVGHVIVHAGVGNEPIELPQAGKPQDPVYLTGPYKGAPFGLAIVVPAEAGPFNLDEGGHPVVVRAKIEVNPHTAQVSIASGPMPTRLQGIPLDVRSVEVIIDRSEFTFDPTNCEAMSVTGSIGSAEGAKALVSSRFQAANCASLPFKPTFSAQVHAHHTRKNGAYLHVTITSGFGQASLRKVHVVLPKALPSRNSTLKQACTEAQFAKDPAGCPQGSFVGTATVHTPVLAKPLQGPAIFVSHGGAAFPDLDLVLKGEGVTIINVGKTNIHKGVTSSTFGAIPDVPVNRIDLVLPEGPHSALAAFGNLCRKRLRMPTEIVGQNGAVIHQRTKIAVGGCKPAIYVTKKHIKGVQATLMVHVPYAGKLTATGKGISKVSKRRAKHGGVIAVTVKLTRGAAAALHRGHRHFIAVKVHLAFHTAHHKTLNRTVRMKLR